MLKPYSKYVISANMKREGLDTHFHTESTAYTIDFALSREVQEGITCIQKKFTETFGDAVFCPQLDQLHVTVLVLFDPDTDYGEDKDILFQRNLEKYRSAFLKSLESVEVCTSTFDQLLAFTPCIIAKGPLSESLRHIRENFLAQKVLTSPIKAPPDFIHSTIVAFKKPVEMDLAEELLKASSINISQVVRQFRLIRSTKIRHQSFKVLETFDL